MTVMENQESETFFMDVLKNGFKADVALYNGGAIRDTLPSGRVTVRDLIENLSL